MEIEKIVDSFDNSEDDDIVRIKISFLISIFSIYKNDLLNEENEDLLKILLPKMNLALFFLKKHINYMDISVVEAKYLINKTKEININRDMVIIINSHYKRKSRIKK